MWWAGSEATLYLTAGALVLYTPQAKRGDLATPIHVETARWREALDGVLNQIQASGIRKLRVQLSGHFARPFLLPAGMGLHGRDEVLQVAQSVAGEETGLMPPYQVWADAYQAADPCLVVAAEEDCITFVLEHAAQRSLSVTEIEPAWVGPVNEQLQSRRNERPRGLVVVKETDGVVWLVLHGTRVHQVGFEHPSPPTLEALVHRVMLANDIDPADTGIASVGSGASGDNELNKFGVDSSKVVPVVWERFTL